MSWYGLATFCVAYFLAVATPGPGVAAVISQALARGSAGAPAFIAGFLVGDLLWFLAAVLGLSALAQTAHTAFVAVKYLGALYLLYLAYKLWSAPVRPLAEDTSPEAARPPHALFLGSLTLTLSNPKPMLFFLAFAAHRGAARDAERPRPSRDRRRHRDHPARDAWGLRAHRDAGAGVAAQPACHQADEPRQRHVDRGGGSCRGDEMTVFPRIA
jgi:LysE type translocator